VVVFAIAAGAAAVVDVEVVEAVLAGAEGDGLGEAFFSLIGYNISKMRNYTKEQGKFKKFLINLCSALNVLGIIHIVLLDFSPQHLRSVD